MSDAPLQILLPERSDGPMVAGVPAALRTAQALGEDGRLCRTAADVAADAPVLRLRPDGVYDLEALRGFLAQARPIAASSAWLWKGQVIAAYTPPGRGLPPEGGLDGERRLEAPGPAWQPLITEADRREAEERLFRSLRSESDGYLARLDRTLSIAISKRLIRTRVTPNQITTFSLLVGLAGAGLLASAAYGTSLLGALLLWSCCVLDGCDGEVARLKLMCSEEGALYDVIADNVVHVAIFVAVPLHVRAADPGASFWAPGTLLISGVLLSMFWVWRLILRRPEGARRGASRVYERIASRDFIYLVVAFAAIGRLGWFLWSAAIGSHLFWLSLIVMEAIGAGASPSTGSGRAPA
ncbi:MAG: CDP-alcohol phosphatidyltransferase family protein [Elusimicrobia bacterium]|nr:CDP-alcohol phosphatidyltransferase family protein [Elusimicrobiota bacterium]